MQSFINADSQNAEIAHKVLKELVFKKYIELTEQKPPTKSILQNSPKKPEAINSIYKKIRSTDWKVRCNGIDEFVEISSQNSNVSPLNVLCSSLNDTNVKVQFHALKGLAKLIPLKTIVPHLNTLMLAMLPNFNSTINSIKEIGTILTQHCPSRP